MSAPNHTVEQIAAAVAERLGFGEDPSTITVREISALYELSPEFLALKAVKTERGRLRHLIEILGGRRASRLSLVDIDEYRTLRRGQPGRRGKTVQAATRNREVVRLGAMLKWAAERGYIRKCPLPRLKMEPEENERSTSRTDADMEKIVAAAKEMGRPVIAAIIATSYDSGLRKGEVCRIAASQFDFSSGTILLHAKQTKGKRGRTTILSSWAERLIRSLPPHSSPFMFVTRLGKPYHPRTVLRYYQEACERAGIAAAEGETNWFHDTRSGFADTQLSLCTPTDDVMLMAGWKDKRTMERYVRRQHNEHVIAARARLEKARRRGPKKSPTKRLTALARSGINEA